MDKTLYAELQKALEAKPKESHSPLEEVAHVQPRLRERGFESLSTSTLVVVAGGHGSRLGYLKPKGCFPVTSVHQRTLFELLARRVLAASERVGVRLEMALMTSQENHAETERFFHEQGRFGLEKEQLHFFQQEQLPFLDLEGAPLRTPSGEVAYGPNGNGGALRRLVEVGLWERWASQGIERIHFLPIDNALALPFDPELIGYHVERGNEVSLKAMRRSSCHEKVGVLVESGGRVGVVEYSESSLEFERYPYANLSLFCFEMDFVKRVSQKRLPLHAVRKWVHGGWAWKFEEFIFDVLAFSKQTGVLLAPREENFAPLKEASDLPHVQEALLRYDSKLFKAVTGEMPPPAPFELPESFYYR